MTEAKSLARTIARPVEAPRVHNMNTAAFEATPYGARGLEEECRAIAESKEGERNNKLNSCAFSIAQLVAGGEIPEGEAQREVLRAALAAGMKHREAITTINSAFKGGMKEPRSAPPREQAPRWNKIGPVQDDYVPSDSDAPDAPPFETSGMGGSPPPPLEEPTAAEPLRGLEYLGKVALVGRDGILNLAATPIEYVWVDIAVAGTIVLIAGPPAEGKTTLLFLILVARMADEIVTLLGRALHPAPAGQWVVIIEGEHSEASTSRKLLKSLKLLNLDDAALNRVVIVARKAVRLGSPEWTDVVRMVRAGLVSDIALDTVARVAPADANDEREQVAVFDAVAQAIEAGPDSAPKPIVWAVAHTRKNNTEGGLADVSGSAQRTGQADTVLLIRGEKVDGRTVSTKVTFAKLREDPDDYPMPVTFSITADGIELEDGRSDGKPDERPLEPRILEALESGPKTKNELQAAMKRSLKNVEEAISNLFASRSIQTTDVVRRGRSWKAFMTRGATPDRTPDGTNTRPDVIGSSDDIF
ncbi:MAG: AAA family ATPase [Pseudomonadota bacterium]